MNVAINIEGQFGRMTGVQFYVDSLLDAFAAGCHADQITAFVPNVWSPTQWEEAMREGQFSWRRTGRIPVDMAGNNRYFSMTAFAETRPRLRLWALAADRRFVHPLRARFTASAERRARRAACRYDLLHHPGAIRPESVTYCARQNIATIYDLTTKTHPETHQPRNIQMSELFFRYAQEHCTRVLTISEASKAAIVQHLKISEDRISVTPLAPRAGIQRLTDADQRCRLLSPLGLADTPFVLYAGTLEPRKNLRRLLRAWAQVVQAPGLQEHTLVLAGGAWRGHDAELHSLAQTLGISRRIVFAGYVANETMNALMSSCQAFVYVSESEGFGLPPLEAMACGAPVVSSNVSSLPEAVGDAALTVAPQDEEAIAAAVYRLLTDKAENARHRELSLARAALFTWERTAALTFAAYEAAVAEG